jgi:hypothetical protein
MRDMPRMPATSSCVSPKALRRCRKAERMQACESSERRMTFASGREANNPSPFAMPKRAVPDRFCNFPAPIWIRL